MKKSSCGAPLAEGPGELVPMAANASAQQPDRNRIAALTRLLTEVLTRAGFEVAVTDSIFAAAGKVRTWHPSTVLLDIGLPYRPGSSLLAELKADPDTAHVPVLVMSGMLEVLNPERRAMAAGVLSKPFQMSELLDAVRTAFGA